MKPYPTIRIEGGLFGPEILDEILAAKLPGQKPSDFGLQARRNLTDEIAAAFSDARKLWSVFQNRLDRLPESESATSLTRDAWMIPLFSLLGYELKFNTRAYEVDGVTFAISHRAEESEDAPPVHIVSARQELGRIASSGRPRLSPHALVQEYLNRSEALWGLVTNGRTLRLLRDSTFVRRQVYVEFDLEALFGEDRFADFVLLYRLLHRTRLPKKGRAEDCLLEQYYQQSLEQGGRVRERLREGVEECLRRLANGFLSHPANGELRRRAVPEAEGNDRITPEDFYCQLLRLVYRFLFLLVSEERGLMSPNPIYRDHYGVGRLRRLLDSRTAYTEHDDLWHGLRVLWKVLCDEKLVGYLDLAPLNGELFNPISLDAFTISNKDLLEAFWHLAFYQEGPSSPPRPVNYAALDTEELGSVYESLLDYHPTISLNAHGRPQFELSPGTERKSTGSYYTPPQLVSELIRSALEPVLAERLREARRMASGSAGLEEAAILSIRVLDPACGSGHFLLAAARRLGKELARIRTGEDEPAPEHLRAAIRDVVAHCIYGVDKNPLAVELARVALWLESHAEGKPLTFLEHRIKCGDSLVGVFDLNILKDGLPDEAFNPVEGDERNLAATLKKQNKAERRGQLKLFTGKPDANLSGLARLGQELDAIPDDSPEQVREKRSRYEARWDDPALRRQKTACDLWTAAFFQSFSRSQPPITTEAVRRVLAGQPVLPQILAQAQALSVEVGFFQWPLEFPEVFARGGFDVVLGNPPWERIKLQEQEFFASRDARIAGAPNAAARKRLIAQLPKENPALWQEYRRALHTAESTSRFLRASGDYPLTGRGDINTYSVFAERMLHLLASNGRAGVILPTGIATDATNQHFFADLVEKGQIASLFDFENREKLFPAVDSRMKFCLLTLRGRWMGSVESGMEHRKKTPDSPILLCFFATRAEHLRDPRRIFTLTRDDIARINPNTRTLPVFRTRQDADLTRAIYARVPVLVTEKKGSGESGVDSWDRAQPHAPFSTPESPSNPWGVRFLRILDMSNDSHLFRTRHELERDGYVLNGNHFVKPTPTPDSPLPTPHLPLYEAKMIWHYDHRFGT